MWLRVIVAGLIEKLERKLDQHRADLTHIDGVLRLFQPDVASLRGAKLDRRIAGVQFNWRD